MVLLKNQHRSNWRPSSATTDWLKCLNCYCPDWLAVPVLLGGMRTRGRLACKIGAMHWEHVIDEKKTLGLVEGSILVK